MLVVAEAIIAPVSVNACSLRQSADRRTCVSANEGSAQVFTHARHPAIVISSDRCTEATESIVGGRP
jgi:hypothetical protein